jgi:hypothetical protein
MFIIFNLNSSRSTSSASPIEIRQIQKISPSFITSQSPVSSTPNPKEEANTKKREKEKGGRGAEIWRIVNEETQTSHQQFPHEIQIRKATKVTFSKSTSPHLINPSHTPSSLVERKEKSTTIFNETPSPPFLTLPQSNIPKEDKQIEPINEEEEEEKEEEIFEDNDTMHTISFIRSLPTQNERNSASENKTPQNLTVEVNEKYTNVPTITLTRQEKDGKEEVEKEKESKEEINEEVEEEEYDIQFSEISTSPTARFITFSNVRFLSQLTLHEWPEVSICDIEGFQCISKKYSFLSNLTVRCIDSLARDVCYFMSF